MTSLENIDRGVHNYFVSKGRTNYLNDDGIGKFIAYCEDTEFDEDNLDDELEGEAGDCMLVEFVDLADFPFDDEHQGADDTAKQQIILNLLKKCRAQTSAAVTRVEPSSIIGFSRGIPGTRPPS